MVYCTIIFYELIKALVKIYSGNIKYKILNGSVFIGMSSAFLILSVIVN